MSDKDKGKILREGKPSEKVEDKHEFDKYFRTVGKPEDIAQIAKKIREVYPYMRTLEESGYNKFHDYEYIPIDEILAEINRGISAQIEDDEPGFTIFVSVIGNNMQKAGKYTDCVVKLLITFMNTEKEAMIQTVSMGIGRDKSEKHMFKAITNAFKYAIKYTFMIAAGGGDPEADSYIPKTQPDTKEKSNSNKKSENKSNIKNNNEPDKKKELNKIKKKFSKHKDIVQKECKKVLRKEGLEAKKISELKKLSAEKIREINDKIEEKIEE